VDEKRVVSVMEQVSVWRDCDVISAMNDGRTLDDICVLNCPICGQLSYYNQGSSFYCKPCDKGFVCLSEDETPPSNERYVRLDYILTMEDVADAECEDYP